MQIMIESEKLTLLVSQLEQDEDFTGECFDDECLFGGSSDLTEFDLIEIGVELGSACLKYHPEAKIFYAYGGEICYFKFGIDEDDAIRRIMDRI